MTHQPLPLTTRQVQVIAGLARGRTAAQIAADLGLRPPTIRRHIQRASERLCASGAANIVDRAYRTGILAHLPAEPRDPIHLTARRREYLAAILRGRSHAQIARELSVTPNTVSTQIAHIYRQLGATCRAHAVALTHQHQLTAPETRP